MFLYEGSGFSGYFAKTHSQQFADLSRCQAILLQIHHGESRWHNSQKVAFFVRGHDKAIHGSGDSHRSFPMWYNLVWICLEKNIPALRFQGSTMVRETKYYSQELIWTPQSFSDNMTTNAYQRQYEDKGNFSMMGIYIKKMQGLHFYGDFIRDFG